MIVHLLGWPGVGKLTIARAFAGKAADAGARFVVVDNHLTSLPVLEVVDADGVSDLPAGLWESVGEIREVLYRAIEELAPQESSFVFTNVLVESDPRSQGVVDRLQRLARARSTRYVPVMLRCDTEELRRRVQSPERSARRKWINPDAVERFIGEERLLRPDIDVLEVDVTLLSSDDSASHILRWLAIGENGP